ncbi:MAG: hypothetical protein ACK5L0_06495 [Candidatus Fimivivens sp.]
MKQILTGLSGFLVIATLLAHSTVATQGITEGVRLCMQVLLPSLFPFMIITSFLSLSGGLLLPAKLLSPLFRLLRLPDALRDVWLTSFLGGYPTGAHTLTTLVQQKMMPRETAGQMLGCCVNPGPAFLVLAVGRAILGARHIGEMLLISQLISSILLCALLCRSHQKTAPIATRTRLSSLSDAFVCAVSGAATAMLTIFAFVLTFSVIFSLLNAFDPRLKFLTAILEVTLGCTIATQLGGVVGFLLLAFFIGFGGFSVGFQVLALARQASIPTKGFWRTRLLAGLLNAVVFRILLMFDKTAISTIATSMPPMAVWSCDRLLGAVCIAAMLLISFKKVELLAVKIER